MAHHKDAIKRIRTSKDANQRNRANRSKLRGKIKEMRTLVGSGDAAAAGASLPDTVSMLQKMAQKGVIHPRNAARRISRITKAINALKADDKSAE